MLQTVPIPRDLRAARYQTSSALRAQVAAVVAKRRAVQFVSDASRRRFYPP